MSRTLLPAWKREKLLGMAATGLSYWKLADRFGLTTDQIGWQLEYMRRKLRGKEAQYEGATAWTEEEAATVSFLTHKGYSKAQIGSIMGRSRGSISGKQWRMGIGKRRTVTN